MTDNIPLWRSDLLADLPHGFLGRRGGVSSGAVASLNAGLGAGDEPDSVAINRRRAADAVLDDAPLATVYQVHSPTCVTTREPWPDAERPHADALVTDRPGLLLGIVTADCAPVLLADREAGVVGAAHAGWKGACTGVCESTVEAMIALGARRDRIVAAVGPCIATASYEVDDAFRERILADPVGPEEPFAAGSRPGHWQFDLQGYVLDRLRYRAGVTLIEGLDLDTYARESDFFSFRRATHRGEPTYGRQLSLIALPPA